MRQEWKKPEHPLTVDPASPVRIILRECGFCGSRELQTADAPDTKVERAYWVFCKCGASGPTSKSLSEAALKWNKRV